MTTPTLPPALAALLPQLAGHLGGIAGGLIRPLLEQLAEAHRDAGKAEALLGIVRESHEREVAHAVATAVAGAREPTRAEALQAAGVALRQATDEQRTLESIVMIAIDSPDTIVPTVREVIDALDGAAKLNGGRLDAATAKWTRGQRWRAKRWADLGRARGEEPPTHVARLFGQAAPAPPTPAVVSVYERLRGMGARIVTPIEIGQWTADQVTAATAWLDAGSPAPQVPRHVADALGLT
jgi:hypothetical protein